MHDQGALSEPCDARQDLIGAFRPDERLAGGIAGVEELPDGGLQPPHAPMRPTAELVKGGAKLDHRGGGKLDH